MVSPSPDSLADSMCMKINMYISGRKLKDLDTFSKSDPKCILYEWKNNQWVQMGVTEQIQNTLNPDFKTYFTMNYFFEKMQKIKLLMIDGDYGSNYDTIGEVQTSIGSMMGAKA